MKKLFLMFAALLIITGCGDSLFSGMENKNSSEATNFDVAKKLDNGDYNWILNNPDKANATDYSAAAMGAAGLDPVKLIQTLNDVAAGGSNNDLTAVLSSISIDTTKLDELQTAKDKLAEELAKNPTDPDLNLQLVMTSLTSTITAIALAGQEVANVNVTNGISDTEATSIANTVINNPQIDTDGDGVNDTAIATLVAEDVTNVVTALPNANLGTDSDLNQVLTQTSQGSGSINYDGTGSVTATDVSNYLTNVIGQ
ncbi:MAG TPA: hypothetical protein DCQ99_00335 [Nitrospinae bacterium]|nr:hypothetical protein [Nitrospinota bacterium]HBA27588.1 hypothetical protein [Nitrospinota bacterium]